MTTEHATSVRSPRRERTRERLLDAAFTVFADAGVQTTSIEAVCEAAGFTRGAFYSNFASKEELFHALFERKAREHLQALEDLTASIDADAVATPEGFRDTVRRVLSSFELDEPAHRHWCLMNAEFELLAMRDADAAPEYLATQQRLRAEVGAVLDQLLERFGLRFTVDTAVAVDLLIDAEVAGSRCAVLGAPPEQQSATRLESLVDLLITPR
ncbi:TetR family transcriptional regulator [Isoptericola jiangsuensis]|uniref:TetR family transcriptional regulator n=1 Tax=Isoptericola jiangsuensis TaxID=548579 RepID=A0A2A9ETX0_9MICO|nr:TetR/AcrR family transcriptional regulator [Isoptericola jiangsuensis]PFG41712.1 TetR family transcriptional regulator [Isoptericola jiangsuensis]